MAGNVELSVRESFAELPSAKVNSGVFALAVATAQAIDSGGPAEKLAPILLSILESMLLTPRARAAAVKGANGAAIPAAPAQPSNPLDELRARRAKRSTSA